MNFIKEHKGLTIGIGVGVIILILIIILLYALFFSYGHDKYGSRLDGIDNVKISNDTVTHLESEIGNLEKVSKVNYNLSGKLINVVIDVKSDLEKDKAKEYANKVLEYFSEEEKKFYDIQVYMTCSGCNEDDTNYPIIAYKNNDKEQFAWSNN